jgi:hypothetical protein
MIAILLILLVTLAAAAFAIFGMRYALARQSQEKALGPHGARGLFSDPASEDAAAESGDEKSIMGSRQRAELMKRARIGDAGVLSEAHATGDPGLYKETLDALIESAPGDAEALSALASHIARSDGLRANTKLAEIVLSNWKAAPGTRSTVEMLHIAALSDDAAIYQEAVEEVLRFRQNGKLAIAAEDLLALVEGEYWVLASEARLGGAGFRLKRTLADVRRKLATATPAR